MSVDLSTRCGSAHNAREPDVAHACHRNAGFSYVEVLVATVLIVLVLGPAIEGLSAGMQGARIHIDMTESDFELSSRLEEVLAEPFAALEFEAETVGSPLVATSYSDPPGAVHRRLVFLARYDADDADGDGNRFTGGDDGLLWVHVELEHSNRSLSTLTAR